MPHSDNMENNGLTQSQVQAMIDASIKKSQYGVTKTPLHKHTNSDGSLNIPASSVLPPISGSGSITLATASQNYTFALPQNISPNLLTFWGAVNHKTGTTTDIHSFALGISQLTPGYYFQPNGSFGVVAGGLIEPFTQNGSAVIIDSTTPTSPVVQVSVGQEHLIDVSYPSGNLVARATVTSVRNGVVTIFTDTLVSGWTIIGDFMIT